MFKSLKQMKCEKEVVEFLRNSYNMPKSMYSMKWTMSHEGNKINVFEGVLQIEHTPSNDQLSLYIPIRHGVNVDTATQDSLDRLAKASVVPYGKHIWGIFLEDQIVASKGKYLILKVRNRLSNLWMASPIHLERDKDGDYVWKNGTSLPFRKLRGEDISKEKTKSIFSIHIDKKEKEPKCWSDGRIYLPHGLYKTQHNTFLTISEIVEKTEDVVKVDFYKCMLAPAKDLASDGVIRQAQRYTFARKSGITRSKEDIAFPDWLDQMRTKQDFVKNPLNTEIHHVLEDTPGIESENVYITSLGDIYIRLGGAWVYVMQWWLENYIKQMPDEIQGEYKRALLAQKLLK